MSNNALNGRILIADKYSKYRLFFKFVFNSCIYIDLQSICDFSHSRQHHMIPCFLAANWQIATIVKAIAIRWTFLGIWEKIIIFSFFLFFFFFFFFTIWLVSINVLNKHHEKDSREAAKAPQTTIVYTDCHCRLTESAFSWKYKSLN